MQVRRVAVVATGALATAAVMGSTPAWAAGSEAAPEVASVPVDVLAGDVTQRASDEAMRELAEQWLTVVPEQTWPAPWETEPPQILSVASGSAASGLSWQVCGAAGVGGVGGTVPVGSPSTVLGDCNNGDIDIADSGNDALISVLDNTAISLAPWQACGGSVVWGVGGTVPLASPNTVAGSCSNGNISIGSPDEGDDNGDNGNGDYGANGNGANGNGANGGNGYGADGNGMSDYPYHSYYEAGTAAEQAAEEQTVALDTAPWEQDVPQVLSVGSGSAVSGASWQVCGATAVGGVGGTVPLASPNTVLGDCDNGNIDIHGDGNDALFSFLDNTAISVASWQACGATAVWGVGGAVPIGSPNTVTGDCNNGTISIR